jgi:hypothetical protein
MYFILKRQCFLYIIVGYVIHRSILRSRVNILTGSLLRASPNNVIVTFGLHAVQIEQPLRSLRYLLQGFVATNGPHLAAKLDYSASLKFTP